MQNQPVLTVWLIFVLIILPLRSRYRLKRGFLINPRIALLEKTGWISLLIGTLLDPGVVFADVHLSPSLLATKIAVCVALMALLDALSFLIQVRGLKSGSVNLPEKLIESTTFKFSQSNGINHLLTVVYFLISSVWEELFFRATLFEVSQVLALPAVVFILGSSVCFALQHLYAGKAQVAYSFFFGILFSGLYALFGSLTAVICCHFFGNMVTYYVARPLLAKKLSERDVFF